LVGCCCAAAVGDGRDGFDSLGGIVVGSAAAMKVLCPSELEGVEVAVVSVVVADVDAAKVSSALVREIDGTSWREVFVVSAAELEVLERSDELSLEAVERLEAVTGGGRSGSAAGDEGGAGREAPASIGGGDGKGSAGAGGGKGEGAALPVSASGSDSDEMPSDSLLSLLTSSTAGI
jgi:hypothetical protein